MAKSRKLIKRILSFVLVFAMVIALFPQMSMEAKAASASLSGALIDSDIELSCSGENGTWTAGGDTVNGSVSGQKVIAWYNAKNTTLTITNKKSVAATLSFSYQFTKNGGKVQVPKGTEVDAAGTYETKLEAGSSCNIYIESAKSTNSTKVELSNIKLVADATATTTFKVAQHGSYTVNGSAVTEEYSVTQSSTKAYELVATAEAGYKFFAWYDVTNGTVLSYEASTSLNVEKDSSIVPKFIDENAAIFDVNGVSIADLGEAVTLAQEKNVNKITLKEAGMITGTYTIPKGITLLIPFDAVGTLYTDTPGYTTTDETQYAYKTLRMASGSSIDVQGAISVGGKHFTSTSTQVCKPTGAYGYIIMDENSSIELENASALYAWGYISGDGKITAKTGSNVYEYFQITDWRGGSQTSDMLNNTQKVFPFSQYYVQNIEANLTIESGATEYTYITVTASGISRSATIPFVGEKGLFTLADGSTISKVYDHTSDRMKFSVDGDAAVNSIALSVNFIIININVNSADYVLPINNNIDLNVQSGTLTINEDVALQPGVSVTIAKDATMKVASGASLYVYDKDQWSSSYVHGSNANGIQPVAYSPSGKGSRSISDVKIDVNGTLIAAGGIYTTNGGANITSSEGTGNYVQDGAPGTKTAVYQYNQSSSSYVDIPVTAAKLHNADDTYFETAGVDAGRTIAYNDDKWNIVKNHYTVKWINDDGTLLETDANVEEGTIPTYNGDTPQKDADDDYTYTFKGWDPEVSEVTGDVTYKATYDETQIVKKYTVTWKNWDGSELKSEEVEAGTMPVWSGDDPVRESANGYTYTFKGWTPELKEVTGDVTYTAEFDAVKNLYTVTWVDEDGTVLDVDENVEYGTDPLPLYSGKQPAKEADHDYTYTFAGWTPEVTPVTKDVTYTATYTKTPIVRHTVTFDANGGTGKMDPQEFVQGTEGKLHANEFSRENYSFNGWNTEADGSGATYADEGAIIDLTEDITLYAQWKIENGLEYDGDDIYWVQNGERVMDAGLVQVKDADGHNLYYYFGEDGKAVKNVPAGGQDYWVSKTNDLLPEWGYYFDENGVILHDEQFQNGINKDAADGQLYYYVDGIKVHKGMFVVDGNYYYAKSNGSLIVDRSYYCSRNNGLKSEGTYSFDSEGKMIIPDETKNGIVEENGSLYYYVDGTLSYAGLIQIDGSYYYVRSNGEVVHGRSYWITKTNGLLPEQSYTFEADGKMANADTTKDGIVSEDGTMYYYQNGVRTYAGLIELNGDYYYVKSTGEVVHNCNYWISKTNGLLPEQSYTFDEDGKLVQGDKTKNGIVSEDGTMYYYVDGIKTYAGLIEIDGSYYYVKSSGEVVHGRSYWISKTNGLLPEKSYTFADDGKLIK